MSRGSWLILLFEVSGVRCQELAILQGLLLFNWFDWFNLFDWFALSQPIQPMKQIKRI
jgi:hypothetical protein